MKKNHDYVHHYRGYWSGSGRCPTRIYQEDGRAPGVICSQPPDDPNTSVTNMAEYLAAEVITEYKLWPVERPSGCSGWGALGDGVCHPCFEVHSRGLGCARTPIAQVVPSSCRTILATRTAVTVALKEATLIARCHLLYRLTLTDNSAATLSLMGVTNRVAGTWHGPRRLGSAI